MLTLEQKQKLKSAGYSDDKISAFESQRAIKNPEQSKPTKSLGEKVLGFTGGEKIAQGLGQAMANPEISKQIAETQQQQFTIQGNLLKAIKEKKEKGGDVSRLENALSLLNQDITDTGAGAEKLMNQKELTGKQVVGDALQLATTVAGAGTYGKGAAGMTSFVRGKALPSAVEGITKASSVGKGIVQGAKTASIAGGAYGASSGVSNALKNDGSAKDIVLGGLKGAAIGAVTGGVLGGVVGGVSGGVRGLRNKAGDISKKSYLKAITPDTKDLSTDEYQQLVRKGKISSKTSTNPDKYILSKEEIKTANKYKRLIGNDPVKNTQNFMREIEKKDVKVEKFLETKNGFFNERQLKKQLTDRLKEVDDLTIDEKRLTKLKKGIVDNFVKSLKKKDMVSLWKARKEYDKAIESAFSGSPTLQKKMKIEFRNAVQDFISTNTDDVTYKGYMKEMSQLFKLAEVTETKAAKQKGMSAVQLWVKRNPNRAKLVGGLVGSGIITGAGAAIID